MSISEEKHKQRSMYRGKSNDSMQGLSSNDGVGLDEESLRRPLDPDVEEEQSHNSIISEEDSAFEDQTPAARKGKKHRKGLPGFGGVENLD